MIRKQHTDREYENELRELRERILLMAGHVEEMIAKAVKAVVERDVDLARTTIDIDPKVNRAEVATDELCLLILAKRQPLGSDLRFITLALKMVTDLERIGDLAVNICERAIDLANDPPLKPYEDIPQLAQIVQSMVRMAIDAFVAGDADLAKQVIDKDDEVDALYHQLFRDLLSVMTQNAATIERGIHVQSIAKWLERMADHSTNLAEHVIFMVNGMDVRHSGKLAAR